MKSYELTLVFGPDLAEKEREQSVGLLTELIEKKAGQVASIDIWGKRDLAYPIAKQNQGVYVLVTFSGAENAISSLDQKIRTMDEILRHLLVRKEAGKKQKTVSDKLK